MLKIKNMHHEGNETYIIIKYLWLFVILPKTIQFLFFLLLAVYGLIKNKGRLKIPKVAKPFLYYTIVHTISITINTLFGQHDISRIFAAWNTNIIWYIAILFFSLSYEKNIETDKNKIGKYCATNILILFVLFLVSKFLKIETVNFIFFKRNLSTIDWVSTGVRTRFCGFMEYPTLVGLFTVLLFPMALKYIVEFKKHYKMGFLFIIMLYMPIYDCGSRTGIIMGLLVCLLGTYYVMLRMNIPNPQKMLICACAISAVLVFIFINFEDIYLKIYEVVMMRGNSTSMRSTIYKTSITKTINQSMLIGIGVKDLISGYPLGSHNTYIGIFYKTGVIGSIFFIWGLYGLVHRAWNIKKQTGDYLSFFSKLLFWMMLVTEDLDGANWLIVTFFILEALFMRFSNSKAA